MGTPPQISRFPCWPGRAFGQGFTGGAWNAPFKLASLKTEQTSLIFLCRCVCAPCICPVRVVQGQSAPCSLAPLFSPRFGEGRCAWHCILFLPFPQGLDMADVPTKTIWLGQRPFFPHPPSTATFLALPLSWDRAEGMILSPECKTSFAGLSHSSWCIQTAEGDARISGDEHTKSSVTSGTSPRWEWSVQGG